MKAILLVGGLGTRLRPLTLSQPKALLPVLNRPFLAYQLDLLKQGGVRDVLLAAGRNARAWERSLKSLSRPGLRLHFAYEPQPLGTGGAIRYAFDHLRSRGVLDDQPVLVFNGDVFFDLDIRAALRFHDGRRSDATIALTRVKDPSRFGVVLTSRQGRVRKFIEKPKRPVGSNWVNAGAYLLEPAWIERIPAGRPVSIERDTFPAALRDGDRLFGLPMTGYWNDIGTHATYLDAHRDLLTGRHRWTPAAYLRKRARFSGGRGRVILGDGCRVDKSARFEGFACAGRGVRVGAGSFLRDCVILDGARIGAGVRMERSIVGPRAVVGDNAVLAEGTVLGAEARIPPYSRC